MSDNQLAAIACFLLAGIGVLVIVLLWEMRKADDNLADVDAPVPYTPTDGFERHASEALAVAGVFTQAEVERLRAIAAADARAVQS